MTMKGRDNTQSISSEAVLSSGGGFTAFSYGGYTIRFKAPYSLERYQQVVSLSQYSKKGYYEK